MAIDLSDYEAGTPFEGDYDAVLDALQARLSRILVAHIVHKRRAAIVFEGWDASGKGGAIKRLTADWDPRNYCVYPIGPPTEPEQGRHFLWRFWTRLPAAGSIAVFDRSWYGRVLAERVEGLASAAEWQRAYDEINEFEAQQIDAGMTIVKLFLHVTAETQGKRLKARLDHPWKRWKVQPDDFRNRARRDDYLVAIRDMFAQTDTRWAPWCVIDGNDKKAARIACLTAIADQLELSLPMQPPPPPEELAELARQLNGDGSGSINQDN